jgi:hypothetical protein
LAVSLGDHPAQGKITIGNLAWVRAKHMSPAGVRRFDDYPLTRMGQTLSLPFFAMTEWADRWLGGGIHPLELRSKSTGRKLRVALIDKGRRIAKGSDVDVVIDPRVARDPCKGS